MKKIEAIQAIKERIKNLPPSSDGYYQLTKSIKDKDRYFDGVQLTSKGTLLIWYSTNCDNQNYSIVAKFAEKIPNRVLQTILKEPFEL